MVYHRNGDGTGNEKSFPVSLPQMPDCCPLYPNTEQNHSLFRSPSEYRTRALSIQIINNPKIVLFSKW